MPGEYLGHLPVHDPLFEYLSKEIYPQLGSDCREGIRVFKTNGSNAVYVYEDRLTNQRVVGKFFYSERMQDWELAGRRLDREYRNINEFRSYLDESIHYVARVLGRNDELNRLLVVEYCFGEGLDSVILRSINEHNDALLFDKLKALAYFLATVHNRSARPAGVDFDEICRYYHLMLNNLLSLLSPEEKGYFETLCGKWHENGVMWEDQEVLVHGDATPANFFFGDDLHVISFDMERVRRTDRLFDVGRIAAELQHFFARTTGNKYAAEPFIGHFLWEYSCHFPDRDRAFAHITKRVPFYMGMNFLRIARNDYLDHEYRRKLIEEAKICLQRIE